MMTKRKLRRRVRDLEDRLGYANRLTTILLDALEEADPDAARRAIIAAHERADNREEGKP